MATFFLQVVAGNTWGVWQAPHLLPVSCLKGRLVPNGCSFSRLLRLAQIAWVHVKIVASLLGCTKLNGLSTSILSVVSIFASCKTHRDFAITQRSELHPSGLFSRSSVVTLGVLTVVIVVQA